MPAARVATPDPNAPVAGVMVSVPVEAFWKPIEPTVVPATPKTGVAVNAGVAPASTCPAAPVIDTTPAALTATGACPVMAPPPDDVTQVGQVRTPVVALSTIGALALSASVPVVVGHVIVGVPAADCGTIVMVPEDSPAQSSLVWIVGVVIDGVLNAPLVARMTLPVPLTL